jgi:hypothetical protein
MQIFTLLSKADECSGEFWGTATQAVTDRDNERIQWPETAKAVLEWANSVHTASSGRSWGNIRLAHTNQACGKLLEPPRVDADNRRILVHGIITDPAVRPLLADGTLHSLSLGGKYRSKRMARDGVQEYIPELSEISLCDRGSVPTAVIHACKQQTFDLIKSDGHVEKRALFVPRFRRSNRNDENLPALAYRFVAKLARVLKVEPTSLHNTSRPAYNPGTRLAYAEASRARRFGTVQPPYEPAPGYAASSECGVQHHGAERLSSTGPTYGPEAPEDNPPSRVNRNLDASKVFFGTF